MAVDAMGGDHAPGEVVQGALDAARELGVEVILVGPPEVVEAELRRRRPRPPGVEVAPAAEVISPHDPPVQAVRQKRDSSLVVGMRLVREGRADAFLSAGPTGALLAAGIFVLGRLEGVDRPAYGTLLPTRSGRPVLVLDVGANVDNRPEHLVQFGIMGSVYAEAVLGRPRPSVALLANGTEAEKGNAVTRAAYQGLSQAPEVNFRGYIEARDLPEGQVDVVVCDGFVGNVVLKLYEGLGLTLFGMVRDALTSTFRARLGALLARPALVSLRRRLDWEEVGGAPLLGVAAPVIKCHGASRARAVASGLRVVHEFVSRGAVERMRARLSAAPRN
nr:phosphate acyltransferase PlsX [Caldinitratiruptor microaerophilus]